MKGKLLAFLLLAALAVSLTIQVADAAQVTGSITANRYTIVIHDTVTLTCTYTTTLGVQGTGNLQMSSPGDPSDLSSYGPWTDLQFWDGSTSTKHPELHSPMLNSGVPVTFTKQIDETGYYKFRWLCKGGGVDGAFTEVDVQVVDTPVVLPEAPPLAVFALGFAAIGLFIVTTKKRSKQS
jgi:hypothetical protein